MAKNGPDSLKSRMLQRIKRSPLGVYVQYLGGEFKQTGSGKYLSDNRSGLIASFLEFVVAVGAMIGLVILFLISILMKSQINGKKD